MPNKAPFGKLYVCEVTVTTHMIQLASLQTLSSLWHACMLFFTFALILQFSYVALHYVKGTPYISVDQGATGKLTHWEQMETEEDSLSTTRKFLIVVPAIL